MVQFREAFELILTDLRNQFEWLPFLCVVGTILLVPILPFTYDCLHFLYTESNVGFVDFLGKYVNTYTCYVWLANCYYITFPDLCELAKLGDLTKRNEYLKSAVYLKILNWSAVSMSILMAIEIGTALGVGAYLLCHKAVFWCFVAFVAYASVFFVLIEMCWCKGLKIYATHQLKAHPIKVTYGWTGREIGSPNVSI